LEVGWAQGVCGTEISPWSLGEEPRWWCDRLGQNLPNPQYAYGAKEDIFHAAH